MDNIETIESRDNFWQLFNDLCNSLIFRDQKIIAHQLVDAKSWVDDLNDEWFEFSYSLDYIADVEANHLTENESQILIKLRNYLDDFLNAKYK